jgi:hypothetical protein
MTGDFLMAEPERLRLNGWSQVVVQVIGTGVTVGVTLWVMMTSYVETKIAEHNNLPGHSWMMHKADKIDIELDELQTELSDVAANVKVSNEILKRIEEKL